MHCLLSYSDRLEHGLPKLVLRYWGACRFDYQRTG